MVGEADGWWAQGADGEKRRAAKGEISKCTATDEERDAEVEAEAEAEAEEEGESDQRGEEVAVTLSDASAVAEAAAAAEEEGGGEAVTETRGDFQPRAKREANQSDTC